MTNRVLANRLLIGFFAGCVAVLLFHQPALALLKQIGLTQATIYPMKATAPLGVPQVLSATFWGGVWGIVFALVARRFPGGGRHWLYAFLFGAIFPTLVAWFIVAPIKGAAPAGGWDVYRMLTGFIVNGAWGLGTAILMALMLRTDMRRRWRLTS